MRHTFWLAMALAVSAGAQWRHFGDGRPAVAQSNLEREMLAAHAAVRARVGLPPLAWSERVAAHAQVWADALLARHQFAHTPKSPFGQNLYEIRGASASSAEVVKAWAAEAREYDYNSNQCRGVCGHYTQIVWAGTQAVGCGVARGGGREVWVCDYDPPGNWVGRRPY